MTSRCSLHTLLPTPHFVLALALSTVAPVATEAAEADDPFSGTYEVKGMTTDLASGDTRRIEGYVVLTRQADHWNAKADLSTDFPTQAGAVHTDVIGNGEGTRAGDGLDGTAHTQLIIGMVPGVDAGFAMVPRQVGPRIVSMWKAHREKDGSLAIELANSPEKGEHYSPTKTTLRGTRVESPPAADRN